MKERKIIICEKFKSFKKRNTDEMLMLSLLKEQLELNHKEYLTGAILKKNGYKIAPDVTILQDGIPCKFINVISPNRLNREEYIIEHEFEKYYSFGIKIFVLSYAKDIVDYI